MIPYDNLSVVNQKFHETFQQEVSKFLETGWYILGKGVETFEQAFAKANDVNYCIGVANGLDALTLSLKALQLPANTEVIVPANTYIASILAVIHAGYKPVLVDPDIHTYNIDPALIEAAITPNTKVIMVVHLYGKCCNMDAVNSIAKKHNLIVIEDCAQAHYATYKGQKAGTFGTYSAFSFYPGKNLGAIGDAGAVVCQTESLATAIKYLRNYGSIKKYYNEFVGYNSRLDELQAIFLSIKLKGLQAITDHKRKIAALYLSELKSDFIKPSLDEDYYDVYHIFNIRHPKRDELREYLRKKDIITEIHYPVSPNLQKGLQPYFANQTFPVSEQIHATTLSLPCSLCHSEDDIAQVIDALNKF
jgi:dTDP-4-amino-4,6-dideoxygalactose transaminase